MVAERTSHRTRYRSKAECWHSEIFTWILQFCSFFVHDKKRVHKTAYSSPILDTRKCHQQVHNPIVAKKIIPFESCFRVFSNKPGHKPLNRAPTRTRDKNQNVFFFFFFSLVTRSTLGGRSGERGKTAVQWMSCASQIEIVVAENHDDIHRCLHRQKREDLCFSSLLFFKQRAVIELHYSHRFEDVVPEFCLDTLRRTGPEYPAEALHRLMNN